MIPLIEPLPTIKELNYLAKPQNRSDEKAEFRTRTSVGLSRMADTQIGANFKIHSKLALLTKTLFLVL